MSTDIAEFVGAALGLNLLFGVPMLWAGVITGVVAFGILALADPRLSPLRARDHRAAGDHLPRFLYETLKIGPSVHGRSVAGAAPDHHDAVYVAVGIIGATVMRTPSTCTRR